MIDVICVTIDLCGLPKITDFCCNYFEVLHCAYFIRYKVRGGPFDLAVEVTQSYPYKYNYTLSHSTTVLCILGECWTLLASGSEARY